MSDSLLQSVRSSGGSSSEIQTSTVVVNVQQSAAYKRTITHKFDFKVAYFSLAINLQGSLSGAVYQIICMHLIRINKYYATYFSGGNSDILYTNSASPFSVTLGDDGTFTLVNTYSSSYSSVRFTKDSEGGEYLLTVLSSYPRISNGSYFYMVITHFYFPPFDAQKEGRLDKMSDSLLQSIRQASSDAVVPDFANYTYGTASSNDSSSSDVCDYQDGLTIVLSVTNTRSSGNRSAYCSLSLYKDGNLVKRPQLCSTNASQHNGAPFFLILHTIESGNLIMSEAYVSAGTTPFSASHVSLDISSYTYDTAKIGIWVQESNTIKASYFIFPAKVKVATFIYHLFCLTSLLSIRSFLLSGNLKERRKIT